MKNNLEFSATYGSLSTYIDQAVDSFIPSVVGKVRTLDYVTIVPDVKNTKELVTESTTVAFVDSSSCSTFADNGTTALDRVNIAVARIKHEESFCLTEMEKYFFAQYMRSGSTQEELPFEQAFMDEKYGKLAKALDVIYWQGKGSNPSITGMLTLVQNSGVNLTGSSFAVSTAITHGIIATFDNMVDNLDADYASEEDLVIYCGQDTFDKYTRSIRNLNLYHFSPDEINGAAVPMFGKRNVTIVATVGLNGTNKAVLHKKAFMFWGTDLAPADEAIKGWFDNNLDKYCVRYKVKIGAALAFGSKAVIAR